MRDGVLLGVERRRHRTDEAKLAILGEVGMNGWTVAVQTAMEAGSTTWLSRPAATNAR